MAVKEPILHNRLLTKLDLVITKTEKLSVCTFGSKTAKDLITGTSEILLLLKDGNPFKMKVDIVPRISGTISRVVVSAGKLKKVVNVFELADSIPYEEESSTIDILLGNDYYLDLVMCTGEQRKEVSPELYLIPSKLGWTLTGRLECEILNSCLLSVLTYTAGPVAAAIPPFQISNHIDSDGSMIEDLWKLDSIGIKEPIIPDDDIAMEYFENSIQYSDGRYHVSWPWKTSKVELPDNYELSCGRLQLVLKQLKKSPEILKKYTDVIEDQLSKGTVETAPPLDDNSCHMAHYIPHHEVLTPQNHNLLPCCRVSGH